MKNFSLTKIAVISIITIFTAKYFGFKKKKNRKTYDISIISSFLFWLLLYPLTVFPAREKKKAKNLKKERKEEHRYLNFKLKH